MDELMSLPVTLSGLGGSIAAAVYLLWKERRPHEFGKVRLVPPMALLFAAFFTMIVMAARALSLVGVPTHEMLGY